MRMFKVILLAHLILFHLSTLEASVDAYSPLPNLDVCSPLKSPIFYQVEEGDTLTDIARTFDTNPWGESQELQSIIELNKFENDEAIVPGQMIQLPFACEENAKKFTLISHEQHRLVSFENSIKFKSIKGTEGALTYAQFNKGIRGTSAQLSPKVTKEEMKPSGSSEIQDKEIELLDFQSRYGLSFLSSYKRIDSKDVDTKEDAVIVSDPSIGFGLDYVQKWSNSFSNSFYLNQQNLSMRSASVGELKNPKQSLMELGLGFHYRGWEKTLLSFRAFYGETLFARGIESGVASLDKIFQSGVAAQVRQNIFFLRTSGLDALFGLRTMFAEQTEEYKLSVGHGYFAGAAYSKDLKDKELEIRIIYSSYNQDSNRFQQDEKNIEASVRLIWELGEGHD